MNSIPFTQNDIVLQLQIQSKPWRLLQFTDKTIKGCTLYGELSNDATQFAKINS